MSTYFIVLISGRLATALTEADEQPVKQNKKQQQADVMSHLDVKQHVSAAEVFTRLGNQPNR